MGTKTETSSKPTAVQIRKKRQRKQRVVRAVVQLVFFLLMPSAFVAGFNGVKDVFTRIGQGAPLQLNSFVRVLLVMIVYTMIFGRFFCGYVCAFGGTVDFFGFLSGVIQKYILHRKKKFAFSEKTIRILQKLKYVNLTVLILMCAGGSYSMLTGMSVWDVFSRITALIPVQATYWIGLILLILVLVLCMVQERFFCQFLCPMGAVLALLPILPFANLNRREADCIKGCKACTLQCPATIQLEQDGYRNGECINCGKCTTICPKQNIRYGHVWKDEVIPVLVRAAIFFVLGVLLGLCRIG